MKLPSDEVFTSVKLSQELPPVTLYEINMGESATGLLLSSKLPFISTLEPLAEVVLLQVRSIVGEGNDGLEVGVGVGLFVGLVVGVMGMGVGVGVGIMGAVTFIFVISFVWVSSIDKKCGPPLAVGIVTVVLIDPFWLAIVEPITWAFCHSCPVTVPTTATPSNLM